METKFFGIRDKSTFIPAMAIMLSRKRGRNEAEQFLLGRAGYGLDCLLLTHMSTCDTHNDAHDWGPSRTMGHAHMFIERNWSDLKSGQVIDVQVILNETIVSKVSELYET